MAEINGVVQPTHQLNHNLESLLAALDPKSLILAQNSSSPSPNPIQSSPGSLTLERGPRYKAYTDLRDSKLRMKKQSDEPESTLSPPKKRVMFQGTVPVSGRAGTSVVAQSVPDFSAALRKENRRPVSALPSMLEMTPPTSKYMKGGVMSKLGGSKSANAGEKRGGGVMTRKSYASVEELKGFSSAAASAINGEGRGGRTSRGINKTVLSSRQY
ncbi:hypothetical protein HHK36_014966 [Tetracentron sinense]|uniref:Uncharacterized protein n=1 Tax=Tetracentron sinense TaxID=13715 RepID=A0A834Z3V7_TETSI|nr:hypothetical protein HHK36_014966 [Tetracentron sinense]